MRDSLKIRIAQDGTSQMIRPSLDFLDLIEVLNPGFAVKSCPPPRNFRPNLYRTRRIRIDELSNKDLKTDDENFLWRIHRDFLSGKAKTTRRQRNYVSVMELKLELAKRAFRNCSLCGHLCSVNRLDGKVGKCGLKDVAYYSEYFTHPQEEPPVTPAWTLNLIGCSMSCRYCQEWKNIRPEYRKEDLNILDSNLWKYFDYERALSLDFVGGDPAPSIYPVLLFLNSAPKKLNQPIVWNHNLYSTGITYELLDGIIDVFTPDLRYFNDICAKRLSGIGNYLFYAKKGIEEIVKQKARIICRILTLPNHHECCIGPALEWLSRYRNRIWINILSYEPQWKSHNFPEISRRSTNEEVEKAKNLAKACGLREIKEDYKDFWKGGIK